MNILVTGSNGFIGKNLVIALWNAGHRVMEFDIGYDVIYKSDDSYLLHIPDLSYIDYVMHLGAISFTNEMDIEKVMRFNYDFTRYLIDECIKYNIPIQFASSASVYGNGKRIKSKFSENDYVDPVTPYAWSKYLCERELSFSGCRYQIFRYFNVYGEHEEHKLKYHQASPHTTFKHQATTGGVIEVFEDSDIVYRDFVPVEKVVNTHMQMLYSMETGIWNIGTGKPKSFLSVAQEVSKKYNAKIKVIPFERIKGYQTYTCADTSKLDSTLKKLDKKWNLNNE